MQLQTEVSCKKGQTVVGCVKVCVCVWSSAASSGSYLFRTGISRRMSLIVQIVCVTLQELHSVVGFHVYNNCSAKQIIRIAAWKDALLFASHEG